jgi:small subunit ribosomal protein S1
MLKGFLEYERPRRGEVHESTILSVGESDILVDLEGKRDGVVQLRDLQMLEDEYRESLEVGDEVPVYILKEVGPNGNVVASIKKGLENADWLRAQDLYENGEVVKAEVIDVNRGGVLVQFGRLRGFVPNSHLTSIPRGLRGKRLKEEKSELVGETLPLVVIEVKQRRRRLILSERVANKRQREQLLEELAEGDIRTGIVQNIVDFGAFVDLGGVDGLIHISELDWDFVEHPKDVLSIGDEVEVYVLEVDRERERIALSRKRVIPQHYVEEEAEEETQQEEEQPEATPEAES